MSQSPQNQLAANAGYLDILDQIATLRASLIIAQQDKRREIAKQPIRMLIQKDEQGHSQMQVTSEDMEAEVEITQGFNYAAERHPPSQKDMRIWFDINALHHIGKGYLKPEQIPVLTSCMNEINSFMHAMSFSERTANPLGLLRAPTMALPPVGGQQAEQAPQQMKRRVEE